MFVCRLQQGVPTVTSFVINRSTCSMQIQVFVLFLFFLILTRGHFFSLLLERGEEGEEREQHWCEREISIGYLPCMPRQRLNPQPRHACALTGNWTCSLSIYRMTLQPTESHQPGQVLLFGKLWCFLKKYFQSACWLKSWMLNLCVWRADYGEKKTDSSL